MSREKSKVAGFVFMGCAVALLVTGREVRAGEASWPQFRGPDRNGISTETGLSKSWPATGPPTHWRAPSGEGFSGISVAGGRLFTMFAEGDDEFVVAVDVANGKELWRYRTDAKYTNQFGNGPRSTPTVDGNLVYAVGAKGTLVALDTSTGEQSWSRDLKIDFGARMPTWGVSTSALIDGDRLVLDVGGKDSYSVVALDKKTGKLLWSAGSDLAGYSSPIAIRVGGKRQIVFFTGTRIVGVAADSGEELWSRKWKTSYDVNAATPLFVPPNKLFVSSGYDTGSELLQLNASPAGIDVETVWRSRGLKNQFQTSVIYEGTIYGFDNTIFKAINLASGEELWQARGYGHGSLIYADGHLLVLSDKGKLGLVEATPEAFREVATAQVLQGKSWTVPTLAGGTLYVRNEKEMLALDVTN